MGWQIFDFYKPFGILSTFFWVGPFSFQAISGSKKKQACPEIVPKEGYFRWSGCQIPGGKGASNSSRFFSD